MNLDEMFFKILMAIGTGAVSVAAAVLIRISNKVDKIAINTAVTDSKVQNHEKRLDQHEAEIKKLQTKTT